MPRNTMENTASGGFGGMIVGKLRFSPEIRVQRQGEGREEVINTPFQIRTEAYDNNVS